MPAPQIDVTKVDHNFMKGRFYAFSNKKAFSSHLSDGTDYASESW